MGGDGMVGRALCEAHVVNQPIRPSILQFTRWASLRSTHPTQSLAPCPELTDTPDSTHPKQSAFIPTDGDGKLKARPREKRDTRSPLQSQCATLSGLVIEDASYPG
jgi:hypothetical protein